MTCGTCTEPMRTFKAWRDHLAATGCAWGRTVWEKYLAARCRGSSGRRILSGAFPHIWKPRTMSEETKERLREIGANKVKVSKRRRKR